eukprot:Platyproteum_vivax@DN12053_c0_g1_i1.p1
MIGGIALTPPDYDKVDGAPLPDLALELPEVADRLDQVDIFVVAINQVRIMSELAVIIGLAGGEQCTITLSTPLITRDIGPKPLDVDLRFDDAMPFFAFDKSESSPQVSLELKCNGDVIACGMFDLYNCVTHPETVQHDKVELLSPEGVPAARVGCTGLHAPDISWALIRDVNDYLKTVVDEALDGVFRPA